MKINREAMDLSENISHLSKRSVFLFFSVLILIEYSNTFDASWHFDDYPQIVVRAKRYLNDVDTASLLQFIFGSELGIGSTPDRSVRIYRPVSRLSIAANWYIHGEDVTGYHIVNIGIHILTAFILYCTILKIHRFVINAEQNNQQRDAHFIAFLAAALWAVNPIQTQAVTYIVQRMASLAAMFYLFGLFMYLQFRLELGKHRRIFYLFISFVSYLLAVGSKQNAIIMPMAILLMEIVFFSKRSTLPKRRTIVRWAVGICILIGLLGCVMLSDGGGILNTLDAYSKKPFTLSERLMTQPRILLYYLSQIVYPIPSRLSLEHHVVLSRSLITPWTTLPAVLSILILIIAAFSFYRRFPIAAFGILFYFLNHAIESTILPLEMIFEHRNYLPSLFLFYPVAVGIARMLERYRKSGLLPVMNGMVVLMVLVFLMGTYVRNLAWTDERSLWEDALAKAPQKMRPYQNLATLHYAKIGDYDAAMALYQKALQLPGPQNKHHRAQLLNNIGAIYHKTDQYEKAFQAFKEAAALMPEFEHPRYGLPLALAEMGRYDQALTYLNEMLSTQGYDKEKYLNLTGAILINQGRFEEAVFYLKEALRLTAPRRITSLRLGMALSRLGRYQQAESLLKEVLLYFPEDMETTMCLIENFKRQGNIEGVEKYVIQLLRSHSLGEIQETLEKCNRKRLSPPISCALLSVSISERIATFSELFFKLAADGYDNHSNSMFEVNVE